MGQHIDIKFEEIILTMLFEYECVVIPGFGGFISHYQPAQILSEKNLILPPSKSLTFNSLLKKNDGLLAQEIASLCQLSYLEAMRVIELQVDDWLECLLLDESIILPNVGTFKRNKKGILLFVQDSKNNLFNDAYGLGVIKAQVHKKDGISGKIKEEFVQRQASPVFTNTVRKIASRGALAAVFLVMLIWSYMNFDLVQQRTSSLSLIFNSTEDSSSPAQNTKDVKENLKNLIESNRLDDESLNTVKEVINLIDTSVFKDRSVADIEVDDQEENVESELHVLLEEKDDKESKIDNTELKVEGSESPNEKLHKGKYIIIAGCFRSLINATKFVNNLKSLGYDAHLSGYSATGLHRVAYGTYDTRSNALKSMRWIQSTHNEQAWMTRR